MTPLKIIEHKGHRIIEIDYSDHDSTQKSIDLQNESAAFAKEHDQVKLVIADCTKAVLSPKFIETSIKNRAIWDAKDKIALFGTSGLQRIIVNTYRKASSGNIKAFEKKDDALDFLLDF